MLRLALFSPVPDSPRNWGIGSPYGMRVHPTSGEYKMHGGVDINARFGTPAYSISVGIVKRVWFDNNYGGGLSLRIYYPALQVTMGFAHLNKVHVKEGQQVYPGQHVADTGNSGSATTGPHLHLTIRNKSGATVNPMAFFLAPGRVFHSSKDRNDKGGAVVVGLGIAGLGLWLGRKHIAAALRKL